MLLVTSITAIVKSEDVSSRSWLIVHVVRGSIWCIWITHKIFLVRVLPANGFTSFGNFKRIDDVVVLKIVGRSWRAEFQAIHP